MIPTNISLLLRFLGKNKLHSLINIFGLALGAGSFILLLLYISHEVSFDKFHRDYESLYRIVLEQKSTDGSVRTTLSNIPAGPALVDEYTSVESMTRIRKAYRASVPVKYEDRDFYENRIFDVDSTFFDVFTLPLSKGDAATALDEPFSIILTEEAATRYFGDSDPIGKTLIINRTDNFIVTGVLKKIPYNTHLTFFDFLTSFSSAKQRGISVTSWSSISVRTYIKLKPNGSAAALEAELPAFTQKYLGDKMKEWGVTFSLALQPVSDIHLYSKLEYEFAPNNDIKNVKALGLIAISILLISCINYINMSTGNAIARSKEVGVRKSLGSSRVQLMAKFFGESVLITGSAVILGFLCAWALASFATPFIGYPLSIHQFNGIQWLLIISGLILSVSCISGFYPAIVLSDFKPVQVLKATSSGSSVKPAGRKILVTLQVMVSAFMIFNAIVIFNQVHYLNNKELGFYKEQVLAIPFQGSRGKSYEAQKAHLLTNRFIYSNSFVSNIPGEQFGKGGFIAEGFSRENQPYMYVMGADLDIVKTLGLTVAEGRGFSRDFLHDTLASYLVNESAARLLQWPDPVGRKFTYREDTEGNIVGVVRDFHFTSLHQSIEPVSIFFMPALYRYMLIRLNETDEPLQTVLASVGNTWKEVFPDLPFDYFFLTDSLQKAYESENRLVRTIMLFSVITICIGMVGLFSLVTFTVKLRYKEIGVRKSLGASVKNIAMLLSKEFFVIGLISLILGCTLGFYAMGTWLKTFPYRITMGWEYFMLTGTVTLLLIALVAAYHCIKASGENPARAVRYE